MKTFKQFLIEALFKTGSAKKSRGWDTSIEDYQIYINPTIKELKDEIFDARGFIDMKGNLYLVEDNSIMIHQDILELLSAVVPIKYVKDFWHYSINEVGGIAIFREENSNEILFSESMGAKMSGDYDFEIEILKQAGPIRKKAQKKNKSLKFFPSYGKRIK